MYVCMYVCMYKAQGFSVVVREPCFLTALLCSMLRCYPAMAWNVFAPLLCLRLQLVFAEPGYCSTPMISTSFLALVPNTSSCHIGTLYPYPFIFDVSGSLPEWLAASAEFDSVDDGRLSLSETNFGAFKAFLHNRTWFSALYPASRNETPDVTSISLKTFVDATAIASVPILEPPGNLTCLDILFFPSIL